MKAQKEILQKVDQLYKRFIAEAGMRKENIALFGKINAILWVMKDD